MARIEEEVFTWIHELLREAWDADITQQQERERRFLASIRDRTPSQQLDPRPLKQPRPQLHLVPRPTQQPESRRTRVPLQPRWSMTRWMTAAATIAFFAVAFFTLLRSTSTVIEAEELLAAAIAQERTRPAGEYQHIRTNLHPGPQHTKSLPSFSSTRAATNGIADDTAIPQSVEALKGSALLAPLLSRHRFNWSQPLGISPVYQWRASLRRKRDIVTITGDMLTLRTTSYDGTPLREVVVTFRRDNYRAVGQRLIFDDGGSVEFEEIRRWVKPSPAKASSVSNASSVSHELDASAAANASTAARHDTWSRENTVKRLNLSRLLDRRFGNTADRDGFVPDLERRVAAIRRHLTALDRLAKTAVDDSSGNTTDALRSAPPQQVDLQYSALNENLYELELRLVMLFGRSTRALAESSATPPDWRRRASASLPHARQLEQRLQRLLTFDDLPAEEATQDSEGSFRAAFDALWEAINADPRD